MGRTRRCCPRRVYLVRHRARSDLGMDRAQRNGTAAPVAIVLATAVCREFSRPHRPHNELTFPKADAPRDIFCFILSSAHFSSLLFRGRFGAIASNASNHHYLLNLDHNILSWFQEHSTTPLVNFASKLHTLGRPLFLTIASIVTGPAFVGTSWRYRLLLLIATMAGGAGFVCFCEFLIGRCRCRKIRSRFFPSDNFPAGTPWDRRSFTDCSRHSSEQSRCASLARASSFFAGVIVLLIALTRIYLGAHYVTDVVGAIAAGLAWLVWCQLGRRTDAAKRGPNLRFFIPLPLPLSLVRYSLEEGEAEKEEIRPLHSALCRRPDELVHLQLETDAQIDQPGSIPRFRADRSGRKSAKTKRRDNGLPIRSAKLFRATIRNLRASR